MDNHSDEKTNASRRRFAKSIVSAAAALPLLSVLTNAQSERGRRRRAGRTEPSERRGARGLERDRNDHDTPPPVLVMQGSCIFEVAAMGDSIGPPDNSGQRRKYRVTPKNVTGNIFFPHVKVVTGSGEMLYRFDNDNLKLPVEVALILGDGREMRLSAEGSRLLVETEKTKKLGVKSGDLSMSPATSSNRRARFRYMDDTADSGEHDIKFVRIFIGGMLDLNLELDDLPKDGEELKVMLWWRART